MKNFWKSLPKPFFALAPMADVTDCAFRQIIAKYGKPDVFWTEFVSADGLAHPEARKKLMVDLRYDEGEHPIVAQIFGGSPDNIREAAKLCVELGFDGVDINMGCPDRAIERQCAGSGMIKNPERAIAVIKAAAEGTGGKIPISVKTRLGYNKVEMDWLKLLLKQDIAALTIHMRTRKEMSKVPAHWELMPEILKLRDEINPETLIIGNGDAIDLNDAKAKAEKYGCDGVMLGRAIFGNPWLFARGDIDSEMPWELDGASTRNFSVEKYPCVSESISLEAKLKTMVEHTKLFEKELGEHKNFSIMKKHYKAYVNGFDGAKELRMKLMEAENAIEVEAEVGKFLSRQNGFGKRTSSNV